MHVVLYHVTTHPAWQARLAIELADGSAPVDLRRAWPETSAFVDECLRLYPIYYWQVRECVRDATVVPTEPD